MNKFGKCFTIKFRNDLIFRRWCVCVCIIASLRVSLFCWYCIVQVYTSFNITGWYIVVSHNMYVCIHHPFICNSNCWKHLISLACFMTFLTLKWQHSYMQTHTQTHHSKSPIIVLFFEVYGRWRSATYYGCIWQIFGKLTVRLLYGGLYNKRWANKRVCASEWVNERKKVIKSYVKFAAVKTNITITTKNKIPLILLYIRKWCRASP